MGVAQPVAAVVVVAAEDRERRRDRVGPTAQPAQRLAASTPPGTRRVGGGGFSDQVADAGLEQSAALLGHDGTVLLGVLQRRQPIHPARRCAAAAAGASGPVGVWGDEVEDPPDRSRGLPGVHAAPGDGTGQHLHHHRFAVCQSDGGAQQRPDRVSYMLGADGEEFAASQPQFSTDADTHSRSDRAGGVLGAGMGAGPGRFDGAFDHPGRHHRGSPQAQLQAVGGTVEAAVGLMREFLDPVLDGRVTAGTWSHVSLRWA